MADQPDYYAEMGVPPEATADEIKRAYRKLALDVHPDRGGSERRMRRLNAAWATLGDSEARQAYDAALREAREAARRPANVQKGSAGPMPRQRESSLIRIAGRIAMIFAYGIGRVLRFMFGGK